MIFANILKITALLFQIMENAIAMAKLSQQRLQNQL